MSAYTDKLQEWVDSVKMCEAAGIEPCYRFDGGFGQKLFIGTPDISVVEMHPEQYEFPIAVIEGKACFVGDKLWSKLQNREYAITDKLADPENWSWNQPKTITIELPFVYVDACAKSTATGMYDILIYACRKALEEMK